MRLLFPALVGMASLALATGPTGAQNPADQKARRIAEIEKEIGELQARIGKLTAELAKLQPPTKPATEPAERGDAAVGGEIVKLVRVKERTTGFLLPDLVIYLRDDARIQFSDGTKASAADLKVGQSVTVRIDRKDLTAKREPPLALAYSVVIQKKGGNR